MKITTTFIAVALVVGLMMGQEREVTGTIESRPANAQLRAQLKNLDNDSFEVRTKAMESLRAAGEDARVELEAARKSDSLEVRTRAESLLKELDAKKSGAQPGLRKQGELKPLSPDDEARAAQPRLRGAQPRPDDFGDPQAFVEALRKWMSEQVDKESRFPTWVLPDDKDFAKDFVIVEPGDLRAGGTMSVTTQQNGETVTFKTSPESAVLKVQKKNEAGELVVEKWEAKDVEEFKTKYPEVWEKYHPTDTSSGFTWRRGTTGWMTPGERPDRIVAPQPLVPLTTVGSGPRLGVVTSPVPAVLDKHLKLKGEGVVIETVCPNTLAAKMGLQELDVLIQINDQVIRDRDDILRTMAKKDGPPTTTVKVVREGAVVELSATR